MTINDFNWFLQKAWILNIASGKVGVKGQRKGIDGYQNVAVTQEQAWLEKPNIIKEPNIENNKLYSYANDEAGILKSSPTWKLILTFQWNKK